MRMNQRKITIMLSALLISVFLGVGLVSCTEPTNAAFVCTEVEFYHEGHTDTVLFDLDERGNKVKQRMICPASKEESTITNIFDEYGAIVTQMTATETKGELSFLSKVREYEPEFDSAGMLKSLSLKSDDPNERYKIRYEYTGNKISKASAESESMSSMAMYDSQTCLVSHSEEWCGGELSSCVDYEAVSQDEQEIMLKRIDGEGNEALLRLALDDKGNVDRVELTSWKGQGDAAESRVGKCVASFRYQEVVHPSKNVEAWDGIFPADLWDQGVLSAIEEECS